MDFCCIMGHFWYQTESGGGVSPFVCWDRHKDSQCLRTVNPSLWLRRYQTSQSESVWWWISQNASQRTKPTRECKGSWEGQAGAPLRQDVAEKGTLCVRPPRLRLSPWAEPRDGADGPMGNARGFDPMAAAHNTGIVQHCEQFLQQTSLSVRHSSVFILCLSVCLFCLLLFFS